jgi:hypothetical protein
MFLFLGVGETDKCTQQLRQYAYIPSQAIFRILLDCQPLWLTFQTTIHTPIANLTTTGALRTPAPYYPARMPRRQKVPLTLPSSSSNVNVFPNQLNMHIKHHFAVLVHSGFVQSVFACTFCLSSYMWDCLLSGGTVLRTESSFLCQGVAIYPVLLWQHLNFSLR